MTGFQKNFKNYFLFRKVDRKNSRTNGMTDPAEWNSHHKPTLCTEEKDNKFLKSFQKKFKKEVLKKIFKE